MTSTFSIAQNVGSLDAESQSKPAAGSLAAPFSFADTLRLAAALRAGDEEAFRWIYKEWNERLARYCFVIARGDRAMAAEIVQAAYLRLYRGIGNV